MKKHIINKTKWSIAALLLLSINSVFAQSSTSSALFESHDIGLFVLVLLVLLPIAGFFIYTSLRIKKKSTQLIQQKFSSQGIKAEKYLTDLDLEQVRALLGKKNNETHSLKSSGLLTVIILFISQFSFGQSEVQPTSPRALLAWTSAHCYRWYSRARTNLRSASCRTCFLPATQVFYQTQILSISYL